LQLQHDTSESWLQQIETAYYALHPTWDNRASTIYLPYFWRALSDINIWAVAIHDRGDIVDQIAAELALGNVPMVWIYLDDVATGVTFHHAVCCIDYQVGVLFCWDPQVGVVRHIDLATFLSSDRSGRSSGHAYSVVLLPF